MGVGEVEDDLSLRRPLPLFLLPPRALWFPSRSREWVAGELERRRGDPPPPLRLEAAASLVLDRDLDRDLNLTPVLVTDGDLDLDMEVARTARNPVWDLARDRERDRERERYRDLDRLLLCCVSCRRVLLDGRLPYCRPLASVCCGCWYLGAESVAVVGVVEEAFVSVCPGDPGGVELVTGVNTVSLLTFTSQCPVALYLLASSANTI